MSDLILGGSVAMYTGSCSGGSSVIGEKRSALRVGRLPATEWNVPAQHSRDGDDDCQHEEDGHDGEGEDPLEGDYLTVELRDAEGGGQDAQAEAHGVVLVDNDEESTVRENRPDEDVRKDPSHQTGWVVDHDGTVPVDCHERPGQGSRHRRCMDESGVGVVSEVEGREVDEVENQEQLGPNEVPVYEQHDKAGVEEVVDDEMASHGACGVDDFDIARKEVGDVTDLEDKDSEPVERDDQIVESEAGGIGVVHVPDPPEVGVASMVRIVKGVVYRDDDGQQPCDDGQDLVGDDGASAVRISLGERVDVR